MPLPDVSRLLDLSPQTCRALAERLHAAGVRRGGTTRYARIGERLPEPMRAPVRKWHLRRERTPLTLAARIFMFMDPVTRDDAAEVLGPLLPELIAHGLIVEREDGLVCPFLLNLANDVLIFCDDLAHGGETVMGAGGTTVDLIRAAYPAERKKSALDVGCGAGTAALLLAGQVDHVVGVDINPRAIVVSRFNARLNGIDNVEFLEGDLLAPVAGRRFDLIVSQPAFVSAPDDAENITFLHGGRRGDELTLRLLGDVAPHLAEGGRAVVLLDYPKIGDETPASRVRPVIPPNLELLLLASPAKDLDDYCAFYAATRHRTLGAAFERDVVSHREHLAKVSIEELRFVFVVIENRGDGWTASIETRSFTEVEPTSAQIDQLIAAQRLVRGDDAALLRASLRAVEGMKFAEGEGSIVARLPDRALIPPVLCSPQAAELISTFGAGMRVESALQAFAARPGVNADTLRPHLVPAVRHALLAGLLEVLA